MKIKLLVVMLALPLVNFAQDFRQIVTGGKTYYTDSVSSPGYLTGVAVDSVYPQGNADTIFLVNNTARKIHNQPQYDVTGGILGRKIIKKSNGWFYFFNARNDTVFIKTDALVNESWKFCRISDTSYLAAICTTIQTIPFLATTDTVKEFTIQAKNVTGSNIPNYFNGQTILLSRKYGLTRTFDLHQIPDTTCCYVLAGKTQPVIGFQGITWQDVYNFDVGDEFHYFDRSNWGGTMSHFWTDTRTNSTILSKTLHPSQGTVTYSIKNCKFNTGVNYGGYWTSESYDTTQATYPYTELPADPASPFLPELFHTSGTRDYETIGHQYPGRPDVGIILNYYTNFSGSWYSTNPQYYYSKKGYAKGIGQVLNWTRWSQAGNTDSNYIMLVYYKKGIETWGSQVSTECSAPFLTYQPDTIILGPQQNSKDTLFVQSNVTWTIDTGPTVVFFSFSPASGHGNGYSVFTSTGENTGLTPYGTPYIRIQYPNHSSFFFVKQMGRTYGIGRIIQRTLQVRPNPVTTVAEISIPGNAATINALLEMTDITGRLVFHRVISALPYLFDRGTLSPGIYILKLNDTANSILFQTKVILE